MTAFAVRKHVSRKLKDPTIRTVLRRLEDKGYVTHSIVSGTFIYRATDQGIVDGYCGGSLERVLRGLVDAGFVDTTRLEALIGKIKRKQSST
jgi:predicted transcriptional regulator